MPTINIHAHCADGEYVLALLEQVNLNSTWSHVEITADPIGDDEFDDIEALMHDHDVSDADNDGVPYRMGAGPDEASPHGMERPPMIAGECILDADECLDPFCDDHGVQSDASRMRRKPEDLQLISNTIYVAFVNLRRECGWTDQRYLEAALNFAIDTWEDRPVAPAFDFLPNDSKPFWLIVLWAIQDWKSRGVKMPVAQSMLRGIAADAKAVKL